MLLLNFERLHADVPMSKESTKYWVFKDSQILGPYAQEELPLLPGFSPETMVCPEDALGFRESEWTMAEALLASGGPGRPAERAGRVDPFDTSLTLGSGEFDYWGEWESDLSEIPGTAAELGPLVEEIPGPPASSEDDRLRVQALEERIRELEAHLKEYASQQRLFLEELRSRPSAHPPAPLPTAIPVGHHSVVPPKADAAEPEVLLPEPPVPQAPQAFAQAAAPPTTVRPAMEVAPPSPPAEEPLLAFGPPKRFPKAPPRVEPEPPEALLPQEPVAEPVEIPEETPAPAAPLRGANVPPTGADVLGLAALRPPGTVADAPASAGPASADDRGAGALSPSGTSPRTAVPRDVSGAPPPAALEPGPTAEEPPPLSAESLPAAVPTVEPAAPLAAPEGLIRDSPPGVPSQPIPLPEITVRAPDLVEPAAPSEPPALEVPAPLDIYPSGEPTPTTPAELGMPPRTLVSEAGTPTAGALVTPTTPTLTPPEVPLPFAGLEEAGLPDTGVETGSEELREMVTTAGAPLPIDTPALESALTPALLPPTPSAMTPMPPRTREEDAGAASVPTRAKRSNAMLWGGIAFFLVGAMGALFFFFHDAESVARFVRPELASPKFGVEGEGPSAQAGPPSAGPIPVRGAAGAGGDQAVEFVKNFRLEGNKGTIAQWLDTQYLPGPEVRLDWSPGGIAEGIYMVECEITIQKPASEKIEYLFEVDLTQGQVEPKNPNARNLLGSQRRPAAQPGSAPPGGGISQEEYFRGT